ncbi:unnamed protein product [Dibothriocephalus latus]|uniref:J domain-containing protein n=1 Tax=Dibothriocephalus latus TaxID=60516 RepID=A0A3P7MC75_DIBLA|nr:unnamed protein product [Dibothriocephalus latus]
MSAATGSGINESFECCFQCIGELLSTGKKPSPKHDPKFSHFFRALDKDPLPHTLQIPPIRMEHTAAVEQVNNSKNNYEMLKVSHSATRAEIIKAYRRLAFNLHPDKNSHPGSEEAFKRIVAARAALLGETTPRLERRKKAPKNFR